MIDILNLIKDTYVQVVVHITPWVAPLVGLTWVLSIFGDLVMGRGRGR